MQPENPFKGPCSYEDGDKFYGREIEIKELSALIKNELLTILFSPSGTGKSSLLKAGLFSFLKNDYEFFPIYIHLNEDAVKASSAKNLSDFVIKRCKEEIKKKFNNKENFKINLTENRIPDSLFEFIYNTEIIETDKSSSNEYIIKPLLVFDQFEEMFTNPPDKNDFQFFLREIRSLVESEVPAYLRDTIVTSENDEYHKLSNALKNKQKNFRILFSFREEYLPQFESLKKEIPSIRFTSSRYRLEPFTIDTAADIIVKTTTGLIPDPIARIVAENIATDVEGFDEKRVDPFLMSLICQIIYSDLLDIKSTGEVKNEKIKSLVDNALESYVSNVYKGIDNETKKFIENDLITSDGKKNSVNFNEVEGKARVKSDILKLVNTPDSRLLSIGQFLDSQHITILHDRLLPPLIQRKKERKDKEESDALIAKRRELEKNNRKKLMKGLGVFFLLLLGLAFWSYANFNQKQRNFNQKQRVQKLQEKAELDSTKAANLKTQVDTMILKNDSLIKQNAFEKDSAKIAKASLESVIKKLKMSNAKQEEYNKLLGLQTKYLQSETEHLQSRVDINDVEKDIDENEITIQSLGDPVLFERVFDELLKLKTTRQIYEYESLLESIVDAIEKMDTVLKEENSFEGLLMAKKIWQHNDKYPIIDSILLFNFINKTIFYKQIISLEENNIYGFNKSKTVLSFLGSKNENNSRHFTFNNNNNIYSGNFDAKKDTISIPPEPLLISSDTSSLRSLAYVDNKKIMGLLNNYVFGYIWEENDHVYSTMPIEKSSRDKRNGISIVDNYKGKLSPNGKYVITYTEKDSIILWKLDGLKLVDKRVLNIRPQIEIKSIIFSNNSEKVLLLGSNDTLKVYVIDSTKFSVFDSANSKKTINPIINYARIRAANFISDGNQLIMLFGNQIYLRDILQNAKAVPKLEIPNEIINYTTQVNSISLSPDLSKLLIEIPDDIIVLKHLNEGSSIISPSFNSSKDLTYKKFRNELYNKAASFLNSNSIITIDEDGNVYLCKIYPEFKTLKEAFREIETPAPPVLSILEQFENNPTEFLFNQFLASNDVKLISEAAKISYDNYFNTFSADTLDLFRAKKLYEKAIILPDADSEDIADKLIRIYRLRIKSLPSSLQDFQNNAKYYNEIIRITEKYNIFPSPRQLSSDYGNLAWYSFFTKEFEDALKYALKGLEIDSTNDFIHTNEALGYLFNGKFPEAKKIYKDYKDLSYRSTGRKFIVAFKEDFERLELYGILNKKDSLIYEEVIKIKRDILNLNN
jgi:WD40 repeat protein